MNRVVMGELRQRRPTLRGTAEEKRYYAWLHENCRCVLTGYPDFEIAHTGGLAQGKGMGRKSALWTCLPLRADLHQIEEKRRDMFWAEVGFPDHLDWSVRLYDIFTGGDNPETLIQDMNEGARQDAIVEMLKGTWG